MKYIKTKMINVDIDSVNINWAKYRRNSFQNTPPCSVWKYRWHSYLELCGHRGLASISLLCVEGTVEIALMRLPWRIPRVVIKTDRQNIFTIKYIPFRYHLVMRTDCCNPLWCEDLYADSAVVLGAVGFVSPDTLLQSTERWPLAVCRVESGG